MKKISLLSLILFLSFCAQSQSKFGVQAGAVASKLGSYEPIITYKAGVFAEIPISHKVFFAPELNLVPKGTKAEERKNWGVPASWKFSYIEDKISLNYVELPLLFQWKPQPQKNGFYLSAGPIVRMGIGGTGAKIYVYTDANQNVVDRKTEKYKAIFDSKKNTKVDANSDLELSHFNRFEFVGGVAGGYTLKNGLRLQLQFNSGFSEIAPNGIVWEKKNNSLDFAIGYRF